VNSVRLDERRREDIPHVTDEENIILVEAFTEEEVR
jgi:hypothetical protein